MSFTLTTPDYFETVGKAFLAKITAVTGGVNTYADPIAVDTIKEVGVSETRTEQTIYTSGTVLKKTSKHTMSDLAVSATALPPDFLRWALGREVDTNGGFCFAKSGDKPKEFAFGYTFDYSGGEQVFVWHPRCTLSKADRTVKTSDSNATDPSNAYTIVALPYAASDNLIQVEYDQTTVLSTKNPLTEAQFFAAVISSESDPLIGTETAKS